MSIKFYPYLYICTSQFFLWLYNLSSHIENHLKFIHKVRDHKISPSSKLDKRIQMLVSKKGALDSQMQVIKFTMVAGSLRLLPPLKLVAMI